MKKTSLKNNMLYKFLAWKCKIVYPDLPCYSLLLHSKLGNVKRISNMSSKFSSVTTCVWMLLSVVIAGHTELNGTSVQTVHRGKSVNISCNYKPSNDTEGFTVTLETTNKLCFHSLMNYIKPWTYHSCQNNITLIWIPKTVEMLFQVSNLQINDTGIYKCVVTRTVPPPFVLLREEKTFVQVIAHPKVSVSHVKASDGFHMILCRSEGFYPSSLELVWMRNGEFQNISHTYIINKTNPDGSFTLHSYLNVSDCTNYSCWVNHSSLSQPMILHLSPADCYENRERFRDCHIWIALFFSALLTPVFLIITLMCEYVTEFKI